MQVLMIVFLIYCIICFLTTGVLVLLEKPKPGFLQALVFFSFFLIGFILLLDQTGIFK